jgi:predicted nucleic acid-binding protein
MENSQSLLILDDIKARKFAKSFNINFTGTIGLIIKAKNKGFLPSIKPILNKINDTDFRL